MKTEQMIIRLPAPLKARLDALRKEGYTANGYIRALLQEDLDERDRVIARGNRPVFGKESDKALREAMKARKKTGETVSGKSRGNVN